MVKTFRGSILRNISQSRWSIDVKEKPQSHGNLEPDLGAARDLRVPLLALNFSSEEAPIMAAVYWYLLYTTRHCHVFPFGFSYFSVCVKILGISKLESIPLLAEEILARCQKHEAASHISSQSGSRQK